MNLEDLFSMLGGGGQNAAAVNRGVAPMLGLAQGAQGGITMDSIGSFLSGLMGGQGATTTATQNDPAPMDANTEKIKALLAVSKAAPSDIYAATGDTITKGDNGKLVRGSFSKSRPPAVKEGYSSSDKSGAVAMAEGLGVDSTTAKYMLKQATDEQGKFDPKTYQAAVEAHVRTKFNSEQIQAVIAEKKDKQQTKGARDTLLLAPDTASKIQAIQKAQGLAGLPPTTIPQPDVQYGNGMGDILSSLFSGSVGPNLKNKDEIDAAIQALLSASGNIVGPSSVNPLTQTKVEEYIKQLYGGR